MSNIIKLVPIVFVLMVALPAQVHAQFGYVGVDLGFSRMGLDGAGKGNRVNRVLATFSGSYRPIQNLALGVSLPLTLSSSSTYALKGSGVWAKSPSDRHARYKPGMSSSLELKEEFSGFVRLFPDAKSPFYLEARISSFLLEQSFSMFRPSSPPEYYAYGSDEMYPAIPAVYSSFKAAARSLAPGLGIGVLAHVGDRGFFLLSFDVDFVQFDMTNYSIKLESDYDLTYEVTEYTYLENATSSPTNVYTVRIGGGVRF